MLPNDNTPSKACSKCGETKLLDCFSIDRHTKAGVDAYCRSCRKTYKHDAGKRYELKELWKNGESRCSICLAIKPFPDFYGLKKRPVDCTCKACKATISHQQLNKRRQREAERKKLDPSILERKRIENREWRRTHPEEFKANKKRQNKIYLSTERGKMMSRAWKDSRRHTEGRHTATDLKEQIEKQSHQCYWCHIIFERWEQDHFIPVSRGGTDYPENIVIACRPCNRRRQNKMPDEWRRILQREAEIKSRELDGALPSM